MSKLIKLTPEYLDEIRKDFASSLKGVKIADGKISYTKVLGYINRKAVVYFTETAWIKMQTLIREFSTEVGWHGVAHRGEDKTKDEYYITDILVYPQEVTGGTVNTDQEKYETWLMMHEDDVFNNIRMQGHSHVNMSTNPSGVDTAHQEKILEQLDDDMFYIFMIWNKRGEKTIKVYDLDKNVLFDGADVSVEIKDDGIGISTFLSNAANMVNDKKVFNQDYGKKLEPQITGKSGCGAEKKRKGKRKGANKRENNAERDKHNQNGSTLFDRYGYASGDNLYDYWGYGNERYYD